MYLGEATEAELNRLLGTYVPPVAVPRGFTSAKAQANYLVGHLGAAGAAGRIGVTTRTLRKWLAGGNPSKASARKLDSAYHKVRDPKASAAKRKRDKRGAQQRLISVLTSPPPTFIQVHGTVIISDDESYRSPFGGTVEISYTWWELIIAAWQDQDTDELGDVMINALRDSIDTGGALFHMPKNDCELDILAGD